MIHASGYRGETRITSEIYEAGPDKLRQFLTGWPSRWPGPARRHNPGPGGAARIAGRSLYAPFDASLAQVELPIDAWCQIGSHPKATLKNLWQPRELD